MAKGETVGMFPPELLGALFGGSVEIRKSTVEGKKYPLYLASELGPIPINTRKGQDRLLELGKFNGAPEPEPAPEPIAVEPPELAPEPEPEKPQKKTGLSRLLSAEIL
tara:strand:+ start:3319 stop:3642 length:324 start_codon:yes stop_codon:yes gene_type:complete